MDTILVIVSMLLVGYASFWWHKKVAQKCSEATKWGFTLAGVALLVALMLLSPAAGGSLPDYAVFLVLIAWVLTDRFKASRRRQTIVGHTA